MAASNLDLLRQSHRTGMQFLFTSLRVAFTYLEIAESCKEDEVRGRNVQNAFVAYAMVLRLMPRIIPLAHERLELGRRLTELRKRLASFECFSES